MNIKINKYIEKFKEYIELIKFEHTIFALPFAFSGMILASYQHPVTIKTFFAVLLAMVGGRTGAMALNRMIDANIDKLNQRTKNRAIPAGRITKKSAILLTIFAFSVMIGAVLFLPLICKLLLPVAILILVLYSYTKRFTSLSHLVLGLALGAGATGGWLAVSGKADIPAFILGSAIIFWVAGFDIIYAIQDIDFDRENKLFSVPAWLGIKKSLIVSKLFHIITVIIFIILGLILQMGIFWWIGTIFVAIMLIYEHSLINENDLSRLNEAFFTINGYISIGFFLFLLLDRFNLWK